MSIVRVGATNASAASLVSPAGAAGDIIVWTAYRDASATAPGAISSPVTNLVNGGASSNSGRVGYEFCTSASAVTRTSSNATRMSAVRYRGVFGLNAGTMSAATGTSLNFPAASLLLSTKSWWFAYAGVRTGTVPTPSGLSTFTNSSVGTGPNLAVFDSNGDVTSNWSSTNVTVNNTGHISGVIELIGNHGGFNKYDVGSGVTYTISTENKVANCNNPGAGHGGVRAFTARKTGKRALAWRQIAQGETYDITLGLIALSESLSAWPNNGAVVQLDTDGGVMYMGDGATTPYGPFPPPHDGDYGYTVFDLDAGLMWSMHQHMTDWNNDPSANPNAGTGGIPYTSAKGLDLFPFTGSGNINSTVGMNLSDLNDQAPTWTFPSNASDFAAWDAVVLNSYSLSAGAGSVAVTGQAAALRYHTTWFNSAAIDGSGTLSNGKLTFTSTSDPADKNGVKVNTGRNAGKLGFKITVEALGNNFGHVTGMVISSEDVANGLPGNSDSNGFTFIANPATGNWFIFSGGTTRASGSGISLSVGQVFYVVVDFASGNFWVKAAGVFTGWNNSGTANPDTNTGGFPISVSGNPALYPYYATGSLSGAGSYDGSDISELGLSNFAPYDHPATAAAYNLSAAQASIAVSGEAAALKRGLLLSASYSSLTATGQAAAMSHGYRLIAGNGTASVAGQAALMSRTYRLAAANGSISIAGQVANLAHGSGLLASPAMFGLTGQGARLLRGLRLITGAGSVAATGQAVGLQKGFRLVAGESDFAVTGQVAGLPRSYRLSAGPASVAVVGQDANLQTASQHAIAAAPGSVSIAGQPAGLLYARRMSAGFASIAVAGEAASLAKGYGVVAGAGAIAAAGQAAGFLRLYRLTAAPAAIDVTGQAANLTTVGEFVLNAGAGLVALSGQSAGLRLDRRLSAGPAMIAIAGEPAGLNRGRSMLAGPGGVTLTGQGAGLLARRLMQAGVAIVDVTGQPVTLSHRLFNLPIDERFFEASIPRMRGLSSFPRDRIDPSKPRARVIASKQG